MEATKETTPQVVLRVLHAPLPASRAPDDSASRGTAEGAGPSVDAGGKMETDKLKMSVRGFRLDESSEINYISRFLNRGFIFVLISISFARAQRIIHSLTVVH